VVAARVSPGFFELLGVHALRGRTFRPEEGAARGHRVVVVSHSFWQERFDGTDEPIDDTLILNHESYTVVGVLPENFEFLNPQVELWMPLPLELEGLSRDERSVLAIGRLRPGVTMEQARADMASIQEQLVEEYPEVNKGFVVDVLNLRYDVPDRRSRILFGLLQGAVVFVLLIACVNIANLLLARAHGRRREIALRSVLGAGRIRVVRQMLTESVFLAAIGGVLGLAFGSLGLRLLTHQFSSVLPRYWVPVVDARVLAVTFGLTALAGLLFGLSPAWMSTKVNIADVVKEGGRGAVGSKRRLLTRALVVAEIALSIILIGGGSIMVQSFLSLRHSDPGFDMENLLTVTVSLPEADDVDPLALTERLLETAGSLPGVAQVAAASALPQNIFTSTAPYSIDEKPPASGEPEPRAVLVVATPEYRESLDFPLLQGRFFERTDRDGSPPVVVISKSVADRYWPGGDSLGARMTLQGKSREVVGVVPDVRQSIINQGESSQGTVYVPFAQQPVRSPFLIVRCRMDPHALAGPLRNELTAIDPRLAIGQIQTMQEFVDQFFLGVNFFNTILGGFGFLALLLAALGTYGVLAYNVTQRSQEIGVRMALGASPGRILRMVTRQGATLGVVGLAVGAPGVLGIARIIDSIRVSAPPIQPLTIVIVFVVLFLTTLAASWFPAMRAAGLDPMSVLREE